MFNEPFHVIPAKAVPPMRDGFPPARDDDKRKILKLLADNSDII